MKQFKAQCPKCRGEGHNGFVPDETALGGHTAIVCNWCDGVGKIWVKPAYDKKEGE